MLEHVTLGSSAPPEVIDGRPQISFPARAYFSSYRWVGRLQNLLSAGFVGIWLRLLSDDRRFAIDREYYDGEPMYRTEAYHERGLLPWERVAIDAHFRGCSSLLVAAAGGGREVLGLRYEG